VSNESRWAFGACMTLFSLFGLFIASRATGTTFYWTGLIVFLFGVVTVFNLIRAAFDESEGKSKERHETVPLILALVAVGSVPGM
jgi:hypothetical protein